MDVYALQNRIEQAMNCIQQKQYSECQNICDEIIKETDMFPDAFALRGRAYFFQAEEIRGNSNKKLFMASLMGDNINENLSTISIYCIQAIRDLETAINTAKIYPDYESRILAGYYYYLGMAQTDLATLYSRPVNQKLLLSATQNLETAIKYDKKNGELPRRLGLVYEEYVEDFNSARKYFALAIEVNNHPFDYLFYSWCCYALKEIPQSEHYFKLGRKVDGNILNYGIVRWMAGSSEKKQELWSKFLEHCKSIY